MPEWDDYEATLPPPAYGKTWELKEVFTIMHVREAVRTIDDKKISARLVYDESRLNTARLPVVWSSANHWHRGSMYGTVGFHFKWEELIAGKNFYWIEAIEAYNPTAFRILICDPALTPPPAASTPYDPHRDKGPLRFWNGTWYWNGTYTSEFMYADDLSLERLSGFSFFKHHDTLCRYEGSACGERAQHQSKTGAIILAHVLANDHHGIDGYLKHSEVPNSVGMSLQFAVSGLQLIFDKPARFSQNKVPTTYANRILLGAFSLLASGQKEAAQQLVWQSMTHKKFENAFFSLILAHFDLPPDAFK